jgi:hypothetical protein
MHFNAHVHFEDCDRLTETVCRQKLGYSVHSDLALVEINRIERALNLKMATKTADRIVSGS